MTAPHPFTFARTEARRNAARAKARIQLLSRPEVKAAFLCFPKALRHEVAVGVSTYDDSVTMYLTLRDLDSFKDAKLIKLLEKFSGSEWKPHSNDYTYGATPNRDFHFRRSVGEECGDDRFSIGVAIAAYVKSDSPLCRIVHKGYREEVKKVPITEIVCA